MWKENRKMQMKFVIFVKHMLDIYTKTSVTFQTSGNIDTLVPTPSWNRKVHFGSVEREMKIPISHCNILSTFIKFHNSWTLIVPLCQFLADLLHFMTNPVTPKGNPTSVIYRALACLQWSQGSRIWGRYNWWYTL